MDYGFQNNPHGYGAPQTIMYPQPQQHAQPHPHPQSHTQPQSAADHSYSYYSNANPNPYPYQAGKHEDPSQSVVYTDGGVVQAADPYAVGTGFEGQAVQYGYEQYQQPVPYPYSRTMAAASSDQARKFMIHSNLLDLESKKQKVIESGASVDSVRVCTICNVVCNSDKVFAFHLSGEKHVLKALGRTSQPNAPNILAHLKKMTRAKTSIPKALKKSVYGAKASPRIIQTFVCEVCKIECNCQEALNSHKMGKKHKSNLLKLQQSLAPKPAPPPVSTDKNIAEGAVVEPGKKTPPGKEGLQVKKDRVLQCGADKDAIIECAICDVVCNSKSVYESHVTGKKHLAMVNKLAVQV